MKRILVPLTGTDGDRNVLDAALQLMPDAYVDARLFRRDPTTIPVIYGDGFSGDMIDTLIKAAEERARNMLNASHSAFNQWREEKKVSAGSANMKGKPSADFKDSVGIYTETLVPAARLADVTIVSRAQDEKAEQAMLLQTVLFQSGRPIIVVPNSDVRPMTRNIAIAWDGSREAALAVALAMPLLAGAKTVNIITVQEAEKHADAADLVETLKLNGIKAKCTTIDRNKDTAKALKREITATDTSLAVMGAYSHSRLREAVFGGVTRSFLKAFPMPVFLVR